MRMGGMGALVPIPYPRSALMPQAWSQPGVCRIVCPPRRLKPRVWTCRDVGRVASYAADSGTSSWLEVLGCVIARSPLGVRLCGVAEVANTAGDLVRNLDARSIDRAVAIIIAIARLLPARLRAVGIALVFLLRNLERITDSLQLLQSLCPPPPNL